jgi:Uma2 family endonuclease
MNTHVTPPPGKLTANQFLDFIGNRPREERWQLIDGVPFTMMSPATLNHQRIARNLVRLLDGVLDRQRPDLLAIHEIGLRIEAAPDFRPVADVAVIDASAENAVYVERFLLAAEITSESNTREHIGRKRELYASAPDCLYVLILSQRDYAVEVWARADDWQGRIFRSADDTVDLPDLGFSCRVADLYRGVSMS